MLMKKTIDVLIYFEHVTREIDACFFIKENLNKIGVTSEVLPIHKNRYWNVLKYKPKFILLPFVFADKLDSLYLNFIKSYGEIPCLNFHHEQFYNNMTKSHFMPKNDISRSVYHLSWTERFANDLISSGVDKNKIFTIGNPRTDSFYLKPMGKFLRYKEGYDKLIFIPTSFSWIFVDEKYFLENAKLDPSKFKEQKEIVVKTAKIFFKSIRLLAKKHRDFVFILRPHPFEDVEIYTKYVINVLDEKLEDNIRIVREGTIYDWLTITDLVIGWLTTVNLEASLFDIKNVIYQPVKLKEEMKTDFINKYNEIVDSYERLDEIISNIEKYEYKSVNLDRYIIESFGKSDGSVTKSLSLLIKDIINGKQIEYSISKKYLFYLTIKSVFIDLPKNLLLKINVLRYYKKIYAGLHEDMLSKKELDVMYNNFKNRV